MARRNPLAALFGIAAVAAELARVVREARPQSRPDPRPVRRALSPDEAAALTCTRAAARVSIPYHWNGLAAEEAARLAMAWPVQWTTTERAQ